MDLKKLLVNMGVLGLFVFGLMAFIITTQIDNNVSNPITNDSTINKSYGDLQVNLENSKTQSERASENFINITPTTDKSFGEISVGSMISPTSIARSMIIGFWNIYIQLPMIILGVSPIVASLISSILVLFIIIGIWAIWKGVIN